MKKGTILGLIFFALSLLSIFFIDKMLALHIHAYGIDNWHFLSYVTEKGIPIYMIIAAVLLLCVPTSNSLSERWLFFVYVVIIFLLTKWIRVELGIIFGRNWATTWSGSGVYGSLISNNVYKFHFLQSATFKGSFPSGHSAIITTLCCTFYFRYQRFLVLWVIPVVLIPCCLVLLNYHYLGDCFAGIGLGLMSSYYGFVGYSWLIKRFGVQLHVKS